MSMPTPSENKASSNGSAASPLKGHAACVSCHIRKIRCDARNTGKFPCTPCVSSGTPDCRVHEKRKRQVLRPINDPVPILPTSRAVERFISDPKPSLEQSGVAERRQPAQSSSPAVSGSKRDSLAGSEDQSKSDTSHLIEFVDQEEVGQRAFRQGVRIFYVGKDVSNINFLVRQQEADEPEEAVYHLPDGQIGRHFKHEPERVPKEAFVLPNQATMDELVYAYFAVVHPGLPIIDEDEFLRRYEARNPADPPSLLILQAILMVGAHVACPRPERDTLKKTYFRRAKMLFDARLEWAALLLTWYSDGLEDTVANAWYWVGIAARIALGLGMHHSGPSTLHAHEKRMWRRTWWVLVQFDVLISLSYGRPQAINLDECDVQPLCASDFEGCGSHTRIDYVMQCTELCVLMSRVLRERFSLHASLEQRKISLSNADEALASWCLQLPNALQVHASAMDLWSASLHLTYNNFLILLHRPHPRARKTDYHGPNDADICTAAATSITTIFEDLREKDQIKHLWISGVNALFTAMIQLNVEAQFSNPVLVVNARRRFDSSLVSMRELAEYWILADSTLRLFEERSQPRNTSRNRNKRSYAQHIEESDNTNAQSTSQPLGQSSNQGNTQSDLDVLAAAAYAANDVDDQNETVNGSVSGDVVDWRHLFPFNASAINQDSLFMDMEAMPTETEWREIYWNQAGISGSFGDDFWGWP